MFSSNLLEQNPGVVLAVSVVVDAAAVVVVVVVLLLLLLALDGPDGHDGGAARPVPGLGRGVVDHGRGRRGKAIQVKGEEKLVLL